MADYLISADDTTLKDVMGGSLPVMLYLHNGTDKHKSTTDAVRKLAKKHHEEVRIASINIDQNPTTAAKYQHLSVPAVVTLEKKLFGLREKSEGGEVRPADVRAHIAYLLGTGEDPAEIAVRQEAKKQKNAAADAKSGGSTKDVTDRTFKRDVLKSNVPVLVDFWAPWCGPCRAVSPIIEQLGDEYKGKVRVVKLNVDDNPTIARKYNIMSIPTVMVFKGGTMVGSTLGAKPKQHYQQMLEEALG
jgi:thioredoxin 1